MSTFHQLLATKKSKKSVANYFFTVKLLQAAKNAKSCEYDQKKKTKKLTICDCLTTCECCKFQCPGELDVVNAM